jgi:hypothetical protein
MNRAGERQKPSRASITRESGPTSSARGRGKTSYLLKLKDMLTYASTRGGLGCARNGCENITPDTSILTTIEPNPLSNAVTP